jgi:hypothetical protein
MPAMIVEDRIIYGTAGADWGGRGWIGAFKTAVFRTACPPENRGTRIGGITRAVVSSPRPRAYFGGGRPALSEKTVPASL